MFLWAESGPLCVRAEFLVRATCNDKVMAGVDTVRGIAYQQAQAVLEAVSLLDDPYAAAIRVEGLDDVVDVEILGKDGRLLQAKQMKTRDAAYTWGRAELTSLIDRWVALEAAEWATFEFVTDGRLGPSGIVVEEALHAAKAGDVSALGGLLGVAPDDPRVFRASRVNIVVDPSTVGTILGRAELQIKAMLPDPFTEKDAQDRARAATHQLLSLLTERAGQPDPSHRLVTRSEIAATLDVDPEQAESQRWAAPLRREYLERAAALPVMNAFLRTPNLGDVRPGNEVNASRDSENVPVLEMLRSLPALLSGRTGEGKSTACRRLRRDGARQGSVVLVAQAETYLPGRLAALAADAIADVVGAPMPSSTGSQALHDEKLTLVIDGVSEMPEGHRAALENDLRAHVARGRGSGVIVVGRDLLRLRSVLPESREPRRYMPAPLSPGTQIKIVRDASPEMTEDDASDLVRRAQAGLGEAVENPLLFRLAVRALLDGVDIKDRPGLYEAFMAQLADRSGATGMATAKRVFGIAFSKLLDRGRRYADDYEWRQEVGDAATQLKTSVESALRAGARSGLITTIEPMQTVAAIHDSFADYLAGFAAASHLVSLPEVFLRSDEQRIMFRAQIGGVGRDLASRTAQYLPLLLVNLAEHDRRSLDDESPGEITSLLALLEPLGPETTVVLLRQKKAALAFAAVGSTPRWATPREAEELRRSTPHVEVAGGPVEAAVKLWRLGLTRSLRPAPGLPARRPRSADEAIKSITAHHEALGDAFQLALRVLPPAARKDVAAQAGPLGITALIGTRSEHDIVGEYFPVGYRATKEISVGEGEPAGLDVFEWGRTSAEHLLTATPNGDAVIRIRDAVNKAVNKRWL